MKAMGRVAQMKVYLRRLGIYSWAPFSKHEAKAKCDAAAAAKRAGSNKPDATDNLMPLLFFRATEAQVRLLRANPAVDAFIYRNLDVKAWKPVVIPPFEVKMFRILRELHKGNTDYLCDSRTLLKKGQPVRVVGGTFKGFEGVICRVKGDKFLYVNITGVCAVAVAYIPKCFVEPLPSDEEGRAAKRRDAAAAAAAATAKNAAEPATRNEHRGNSEAAARFGGNNEIKEKEELILNFSDRNNALDFARAAEAEAYLEKLDTADLVNLSAHLRKVRTFCKDNEISESALWLLFDVGEWLEASQKEMERRVVAGAGGGRMAKKLKSLLEAPTEAFLWERIGGE